MQQIVITECLVPHSIWICRRKRHSDEGGICDAKFHSPTPTANSLINHSHLKNQQPATSNQQLLRTVNYELSYASQISRQAGNRALSQIAVRMLEMTFADGTSFARCNKSLSRNAWSLTRYGYAGGNVIPTKEESATQNFTPQRQLPTHLSTTRT